MITFCYIIVFFLVIPVVAFFLIGIEVNNFLLGCLYFGCFAICVYCSFFGSCGNIQRSHYRNICFSVFAFAVIMVGVSFVFWAEVGKSVTGFMASLVVDAVVGIPSLSEILRHVGTLWFLYRGTRGLLQHLRGYPAYFPYWLV